MTKRSVVHIVGDSKAGGVTRVVQAICEDNRTFDFTVVTTDPTFISRLQSKGIRSESVDFVSAGFQGPRSVIGLWRLVRYLRRASPNIVHTHRTKAGYVGRIAAKIARVPIVVHTVHGLPIPDDGPAWKRTVIMALEALLSRLTNTSVAVSHTLARTLRRGAGGLHAQHVQVIPNGIATPTIASSPQAESPSKWVASRKLKLVYVGRLAEQKGVLFLLQALLRVRTTTPVILHIFGDGELRPFLEETSSHLGLDDIVYFHGFSPDPQSEMSNADIVVLPSLWEGLSIALLEAMSLGKPVVTTSISSNREVVEHGVSGMLVPPRDPKSLADAIVEIAQNNQLRSELGSNARERYTSTYQQESMVASYHDLYSQLTTTACR